MNSRNNSGSNKKNIYVFVSFFLILAYMILRYILVYNQVTTQSMDKFSSDVKMYASIMDGSFEGDSTVNFPYRLYFATGEFLCNFTDTASAVAITTTVLDGLSLIIVVIVAGRYAFGRKNVEYVGKYGLIICFMAMSVFFVSMLYDVSMYIVGKLTSYRYLGVYSPNPWHNQTYIAARPFAIMTMFYFIMVRMNNKEESRQSYIALSLSCLLSAMAKPSFALVFGMMVGVLLLKDVISLKCITRESVYTVLSLLPTAFEMIRQYWSVYMHRGMDVGYSAKQIKFGIGVAWHTYSNNILLSIILALMGPLVVLFFNRKMIKEVWYGITWLFLAISLTQYLVLYEDPHVRFNNFAWGYEYGMFFVFISSFSMILSNIIRGNLRKRYILIESSVMLAHLLCGLAYFATIFMGYSYV